MSLIENPICRLLLSAVKPNVLGLACLLVCFQACAAETIHNYRFFAFGTEINISLVSKDERQADRAFSRIKALFETLNHELNPWKSGPLLNLNQSIKEKGGGRTTPTIIELIRLGQHYSKLSDGLFDPGIGKLIKAWQFDDASHRHRHTPESSLIENILRHKPGIAQVELMPPVIRTDNRLIQLDFGGMAKGYAIDKALVIAAEEGIESGVINAGGDLKAIGRKPSGAWRIGIRHPRTVGAIAGVTAKDGDGVFTSGDYERYFEADGKRHHHILDPATGRPAARLVSVTVIHQDAALADAAATALFVAGPKRWQQTANKMDIKRVMLIDEQLTIWITPEMAKQTSIIDDKAVIIRPPRP